MAYNCRHGAAETTPTYLRPFALPAYICEFGETEEDNYNSKLWLTIEKNGKKNTIG